MVVGFYDLDKDICGACTRRDTFSDSDIEFYLWWDAIGTYIALSRIIL